MNTIPLRLPDQVMRLERLGAFHQTRLSFMRALLRHLRAADWRFDRPLWRIDGRGTGVALYRAVSAQRVYTLVCFGHDLDPALRTDRVIAEAWDATFTLFDGEPSPADIERLSANVPKQEAGRYRASELVLLRANRSVRLFDHVVAALAAGRQPDAGELAKVGYLMRTTAVYGNGKFGIADRDRIAGRPEFAGPFRAEMLAVWLVRRSAPIWCRRWPASNRRRPRLRSIAASAAGSASATRRGSASAPSSSIIRHCSTAGSWRARRRWRGCAAWSCRRPQRGSASSSFLPVPAQRFHPGSPGIAGRRRVSPT